MRKRFLWIEIADSNAVPIESRILGFNRKEGVEFLREYCSPTGRSFAENRTMVRGRLVTV